MVRLCPGGVVRGDDFFNQDNLIKVIWDTLKSSGIILTAPRRAGKTSIMQKLVDGQLLHKEFIIQYKNCHLFTSLQNVIEEVTNQINNYDFKTNKKLVIILDEFSSLIENELNRIDTKKIIETLRQFQGLRQLPENNSWLRFILGGSVSIDIVMRSLGGMILLNDLYRIRVEPFDETTMRKFIRRLTTDENIILDNDAFELVVQLLKDSYPYFAHLLLASLKHRALDEKITKRHVGDIYKQNVISGEGANHFSYFYERIQKYGLVKKSRIRAAREILAVIAATGELDYDAAFTLYQKYTRSSDKDAFNSLMADLENEFYIIQKPGSIKYTFAIGIMRDWWRRWHPPQEKSYVVEAFLAMKQGWTLISHRSNVISPLSTDPDVATAMYGAFTDYFETMKVGTLKYAEFEDASWLVLNTEHLILLCKIIGPKLTKSAEEKIKKHLEKIGKKYKNAIEEFDGNMAPFEDIEDMLNYIFTID